MLSSVVCAELCSFSLRGPMIENEGRRRKENLVCKVQMEGEDFFCILCFSVWFGI